MLQCAISDLTYSKHIEVSNPWNKAKVVFSNTPETGSCVIQIPLDTEKLQNLRHSDTGEGGHALFEQAIDPRIAPQNLNENISPQCSQRGQMIAQEVW